MDYIYSWPPQIEYVLQLGPHVIMAYNYSWSPIIQYVLPLRPQEDVWVPKENVPHPQAVGIRFSYGAYRQTMPDGRAIDIKDGGNYWRVHWDRKNPNDDLIGHVFHDAPEFIGMVIAIGLFIGLPLVASATKKGGA